MTTHVEYLVRWISTNEKREKELWFIYLLSLSLFTQIRNHIETLERKIMVFIVLNLSSKQVNEDSGGTQKKY